MRFGLSPWGLAMAVWTLTLIVLAQLRPVVAHPEREPRVFPRRAVELGVHGGGAAAHCGFGCSDSETFGYAAGFSAIIRPAPSYAIGVGWDRAWFRWRPEGRDLAAHVTFYRFAARLYPLRTARLDGWLEYALSFPTMGASAPDVDPIPAFVGMGVGLGLDVIVWDHLKMGPRARADWMWLGRAGPAEGGGAASSADGRRETPPITAVAQLGVGVTVTLGPTIE